MSTELYYKYAQQAALYKQEFKRSLGALVGVAQGLLCDQKLTDEEIVRLRVWFEQNDALAYGWPGDVIYARVQDVLADGVITEDERTHLVDVLEKLIGTPAEDATANVRVTQLAFDAVSDIADRCGGPQGDWLLSRELEGRRRWTRS